MSRIRLIGSPIYWSIIAWLSWFLEILERSIQAALDKIERTLVKSRFWQRFQDMEFSKEQTQILNMMFDEEGFEQGISAARYQKITKLSKATATRHLADLVEKGCIEKLAGGGRSTKYRIRR